MLTEIIINATHNQNVLCKQGRRELAARVQKKAAVIQASWRIYCSENLLWCPEFCYLVSDGLNKLQNHLSSFCRINFAWIG